MGRERLHDASRPGDRMVGAGVALFGVGLLAALATITPLFVGGDPLPVGFYLLAALAPVGLLLAGAGMLRGNRLRRQR